MIRRIVQRFKKDSIDWDKRIKEIKQAYSTERRLFQENGRNGISRH